MASDMATRDAADQQKARGYDLPLSSEVNMTNCHKHCENFFEECERIHFNTLIAYWMMAGYLGHVDSIEEAYLKGHEILLDLIYKEKILKASDEDPDMVQIKTPTPLCCTHKGFCAAENLGFVNVLNLGAFRDVVCTDGMLKKAPKRAQKQQMVHNNTARPRKGSALLIDGNHLSRQVFHRLNRLKYLAYFNPKPDTLNPLLDSVAELSVLLLRGCELLPLRDLPFTKLESSLTVLEISGSSHLTTIPEKTVSELTQLLSLNLSYLPIETLPDDFFIELKELQWVILRGCSKLVKFPTIKPLKKLKVLDLFRCTTLREFMSNVVEENDQLQWLDLSYTTLSKIPAPRKNSILAHLLLKDSPAFQLNSLNQVTSLKVLDLSGATNVKQVDQVKGNKNLIVLDLSRIGIKTIHFLSDLVHLRSLTLRDCTSLEKLPTLKNLTNLEVLDLSGCEELVLPEGLNDLISLKELNLCDCTRLGELSVGIFDEMPSLLKLDLSGTRVNSLASLANLSSLHKLSLRGLQLDSREVETWKSLSNLVELDLKGLNITSSRYFKLDFPESLDALQILDISQASVEKLIDASKLVSLRELLLADCRHLNNVLDLKTLTNLEVLDLSLPNDVRINDHQEEIEVVGQGGLSLSVPSSLCKLKLTNRSGVQELFHQTSFDKLEFLDLCGTDMAEIPYESMAHMKCIQLPADIDRISRVRLHRKGSLEGRISMPIEIHIASTTSNKFIMSAGADQLFHLKYDDNQASQRSWEAFIYQFSVSRLPKGGEDKVLYLDRDEFVFRDNHSWDESLLKGRSVEIHGFPKLPKDLEHILRERHAENETLHILQSADNVALVGNSFLCSLSDLHFGVIEVGPRRYPKVKVCCMRRCPEVKSVFSGGGENSRCPEKLVLSHLVNLEFIYAEKASAQSIESLKVMIIDCCPKLTTVITAYQVPKNLETLHIKFCDKLRTLFEETISELKLQELSLFELPQLEGIEADLSSLKTLSISQCHKLKSLDRVIEPARTSLTQLRLDSCPGLEHVLPSSLLPEELQELKISSCSGLVTLFKPSGYPSSPLSKLHTLRLRNVPKLKSIGGELPNLTTLDLDPSLPQDIKQQLEFLGQ